ncbi:MAG: pyruvate, phosphate dikinase [Deltaproteobacteria bacterium]|nr:pyruvate, phosphate dikinase [Deltaproteobacteria bacterium]
MNDKQVYFFGAGVAEGLGLGKALLGGKGDGLAIMTSLGIAVPAGLTITTDACADYVRLGGLESALMDRVRETLKRVEGTMGAVFGDANNPLLLSVRSGARASMPGMMDTVLNLGLNDTTCAALAAQSGSERFALDAYRRFITMYSDVVRSLGRHAFEQFLSQARRESGARDDAGIPADGLRKVVAQSKAYYRERTGEEFPQDPWAQLWSAIGAVFHSWNNERAKIYRRTYGIPDEWGTACNVQAMVFGNLGDDCATGVCFTRDPANGEKRFFGEYLRNAQGEDVVAGIRTPRKITAQDARASGSTESLEETMPESYQALFAMQTMLEQHFRDMQDIEFTIQRGKVWLLQCRSGKRTMRASVRIAVDMEREGLIDKNTAILRVEANRLTELFLPRLDASDAKAAEQAGYLLAQGLPASPGYAAGEIVFTADEAELRAQQGHTVILVRRETSPEDIHGMKAAKGILTATGGLTSHAAVVARGMGKCCVAGCSALTVDYRTETLTVHRADSTVVFQKGDKITLDGTAGRVYSGVLPVSAAATDNEFETILKWADGVRRMRVRANADTPTDARNARRFGAEGVGLCRTEHMFFEADRIRAVREMILADSETQRRAALEKILPMQRQDFVGILTELAGLPVTIRLLDPPLHEFLPEKTEDLRALAKDLGVSFEEISRRNEALHEFNPMLGHRGCRLAITFPEIYEIQARAIALAAVDCARVGVSACPEVMIPLVATRAELQSLRELVVRTIEQVFTEQNVRVEYSVGTMIELPRACLMADQIASSADFFSFGTNDLTQTTWGLSRDDAGRFLPTYVDRKILPGDPFEKLDVEGVGALMEIAVRKGRSVKPGLKVGICGEHGGEPSSIAFCEQLGLDYVSCSPFRVPTARLAAAQAVLSGPSSGDHQH